MKSVLLLFVLLQVSATLNTVYAGEWDNRFASPGTDGQVNAIAVDGPYVYIGGNFNSIDSIKVRNIAVLNTETGEWSEVGGGIEGTVLTLKVHNGILYAGGRIRRDDVSGNALMMWDGNEWSNPGGGFQSNTDIRDIAFDEDDNMYVTGNFRVALNGDGTAASARHIAKWNGEAWEELGDGFHNGNLTVYGDAVAVLDTLLYAAGYFNTAGGSSANRLARWNGDNWESVGAGVVGESQFATTGIFAMESDGNGNIIMGGTFTSVAGVEAINIIRYDGNIFEPLGEGLSQSTSVGKVHDIAIDGDIIYAAGWFDEYGNIAMWDGESWSPVGSGSPQIIEAVGFTDDSIIAGGRFHRIGDVIAHRIAYWKDGDWHSFATGTRYGANGNIFAVHSDGERVVFGGAFSSIGGISAPSGVAVWSDHGWEAVGDGANYGTINAVALHGEYIYAGGEFNSIGNTEISNLARWNGTEWQALAGNINGTIHAMDVDEDGNLYISGWFRDIDDLEVNRVAVWDGNEWSALGEGMNNRVYEITVAEDGIYAGGLFTQADGFQINHLARWDGNFWNPVGDGVQGLGCTSVRAIVKSDGNVYVGGRFDQARNTDAVHFARWNGTTWSSLDAGLPEYYFGDCEGYINAIVRTDNYLYIGGLFDRTENLTSESAEFIVRHNGTEWESMEGGVGHYRRRGGTVNAIAQRNSQIIIVGNFITAGGYPASRIAVWNETDAATSVHEKPDDGMPDKITLHQNYPNPFNPSTKIAFGLPEGAEVRLDVYDVLGRQVATLIHGEMEAGFHTAVFDAGALSSGMYIYRLQAGTTMMLSRKMILLK